MIEQIYLALITMIAAPIVTALVFVIRRLWHERERRKVLEEKFEDRTKQIELDALERERRADEKIADGLARANEILQQMTVKTFDQAAEANKLLLASMARETTTQQLKIDSDLKLISARRENDDLRSEITRLSEQQKRDASTLTALQRQVDELTLQLSQLRNTLNERESQLSFNKQERERLSQELNKAHDTIKVYEEERAIVNERFDHMQEELDRLNKLNRELTARVAELEAPGSNLLAA
jgi:chromosome segregation ATPase